MSQRQQPEQPVHLQQIPGLSEGRVVHYVAFNGRHLAALVIGTGAFGQADLAVFTNMLNVNGVKNFGLQFHQDIAFDSAVTPGTWHWPEEHAGDGDSST